MKILAIDSSALVASVALVTEDQFIGEYTLNYKKTHSQTLLPMLDAMFKQLEMNVEEVDAIAISGGPGSFTGLRIGSATAKGLGLALGKPLVHVPTIEALAYQLFGATGVICPIMDARRSQVYTGVYKHEKEFQVIKEQMAVGIEALVEVLEELGEPVIFLGDGVPVHREFIEKTLKVPYTVAPSFCSRQRAAAVGALGIAYFQAGKVETAKEHNPDYLRVSQAEREREERMNGK